MSTVRLGDRDAFGVKTGPGGAIIQVFQMRGGRVIERVELVVEASGGPPAEQETVQAAVQQFYDVRVAPPEVHVAVEIEDREALERWLGERAGRKVKIAVPKRGDKRGLLDLATRYAALGYRTRYSDEARVRGAALEELQRVLGLAVLPRRIECFDISTIQGSETVGSMVVCEDGRLVRKEYRKYRVRGGAWGAARTALPGARGSRSRRRARPASSEAGGSTSATGGEPERLLDDFAAMHEVVGRRCRRLLDDGGPLPDLVVIDGGKGQLSAAYEAFGALGLANLVAVGLAKKEELIFTRDAADPIILEPNSAALLLLQRLRDEAHRVAVTYHRSARARRDFRSELDDIPGVGARRRKVLLTRFGSVANVRRATREDLVPVIGARVADAVLGHFAAGSR